VSSPPGARRHEKNRASCGKLQGETTRQKGFRGISRERWADDWQCNDGYSQNSGAKDGEKFLRADESEFGIKKKRKN